MNIIRTDNPPLEQLEEANTLTALSWILSLIAFVCLVGAIYMPWYMSHLPNNYHSATPVVIWLATFPIGIICFRSGKKLRVKAAPLRQKISVYSIPISLQLTHKIKTIPIAKLRVEIMSNGHYLFEGALQEYFEKCEPFPESELREHVMKALTPLVWEDHIPYLDFKAYATPVEPPKPQPIGDIVFGADEKGRGVAVLSYEDRNTHIYMPGKTRYGKSTLIKNLALEDIKRGFGVCIMDGKGDFISEFVHYIPPERANDTVLLDLDTPIPLDFISYEGDREKEKLIGELKYILTRGVDAAHAPLMNANLTDLLYTLLNFNENEDIADNRKATFLDIFYFLDNPVRRDEILAGVTDPNLQRRWKDNFPNPNDRSRITTRMTPFVRSKTLSAIFGATEPKLKISEAISENKILLVNLGPPDEIKAMYGSLLMAKLRDAFYRRAKTGERQPYFLYCDEFQEFQTSDFDKMLSLAGGFGLCMTLAHQYTEQLENNILQAILGNVSTFFCFRLGQPSVAKLRGEINADTALREKTDIDISQVLPTLPVGRVLYRSATGYTCVFQTPPPPERPAESYAEIIKNRTMYLYSCESEPAWLINQGSGNGKTKSDEIAPTGATVPPGHSGKTKDH